MKKEREQFVLQPGQEGRYGNEQRKDVDVDYLDCSVRSGNLYGVHLYLRADNPWHAKPWLATDLIDDRLDVPAGRCFNNDKCSVWATRDSFSKGGSRYVHRYPGGGYDVTLSRGRKDGNKNIEIHVDMDAP